MENFKLWLEKEEISPTLATDKIMLFLQYTKENNPSANLKNPLEKQPKTDSKTQYAEIERRKKEIIDYYQNLPDNEKQNFEDWQQQEIQKRINQNKEKSKELYLYNHPHMTEDDYNKFYSQGPQLKPEQQYQARKYQRNKWLEKTDRDEWNNLTIVHWFPGNEDRKYKEAVKMLIGQIPPHTELSATYYPKDFNMANVGENRWGDFAVQLQGEVVSGHSVDAASDDRWHPNGKKAELGEFGTPEEPVEKFGGKFYTLKPHFLNKGHNELVIRNWKIIALLMYKNNKITQKNSEELQEDQKIIDLAKSKNIPIKIID
jgi:hypothetical protein